MRILTVGAIKGGSVDVGQAIHSAFKEIGKDCDFLDYSDCLLEFNQLLESGNPESSSLFLIDCRNRLLEKVSSFKPDVVLGIAQSPLNNMEMLAELKKMGIALCYWFVEDCKIFDYWRKYAPCFDHFFMIQKEPYWSELRQMGYRNFHYLPTAFDPSMKSPHGKTEKAINVSFMGAPYPNRVHFFNQLHRPDFQIYGEGWDVGHNPSVVGGQRRISPAEARRIYERSIVNLNLHSSSNPASFAEGDFVNPRTFELAGLGAFQLTDFRDLLPLHFDLREELVALRTWKDMKIAIEYFLKHREKRDRFAKKARERVLEEHTYAHRAREIVGIL